MVKKQLDKQQVQDLSNSLSRKLTNPLVRTLEKIGLKKKPHVHHHYWLWGSVVVAVLLVVMLLLSISSVPGCVDGEVISGEVCVLEGQPYLYESGVVYKVTNGIVDKDDKFLLEVVERDATCDGFWGTVGCYVEDGKNLV